MIAPNINGIPSQLRMNARWFMVKKEPVKDASGKVRMAKVPYQINGARARPNDATTCSSFDRCRMVYETVGGYNGIGYLFTQEDGIVAIDYDNCVNDGVIDPDVLKNLHELGGYAEISQSGDGVHWFGFGVKPGPACRYKIEMYASLRFVVITGNRIAGTATDICKAPQAALDKIYYEKVAKPETIEVPRNLGVSPVASDAEIVAMCRNAKNHGRFDALYAGDVSRYRSQSHADLALCGIIAFYTQDAETIDRIFCMSCLNRAKWSRKAYSSKTIRLAIDGTTATYNPRRTNQKSISGVA